ncbi:hypothetical protein C1645_778873 [Glomus cerebriforme]|uniref:Protein kinase domain-containing protein n=1 Tax=Glomus cerebriforme TaxID=658196 RepID=A0A397SKN2_9GLOM|nr:hypothetical protein C1645_778873 [Glomus cerebriforme]
MPYVAPEVLIGKPYTQAADIYSFGMIMYFIATGKQPFYNCAHDKILALKICNKIRPEINEPEAPKCFIDLMKKLEKLIKLFQDSYNNYKDKNNEIKKQFKKAEKYRKANPQFIKIRPHSKSFYTSRILNPFTKDLPKHDDNIDNNTAEFTDFTKLSITNEKNNQSDE